MLQCFPVDRYLHQLPRRPERFAACLAEYAVQVQRLSSILLELIPEGLGLDRGFFAGALSGGDMQMNVNYYPPCPDPSLTLGLLPHCDRHLLTVLSQGDVSGPAHSSSTSGTRWRSSPTGFCGAWSTAR
jgi:2'-deoxymugineic-acid 2'-dioxygenase/mugineic-acid 3-dioxygenase